MEGQGADCPEPSRGQTISGNKNKLIQVVVNLLQNSCDALRKKSAEQDRHRLDRWPHGCREERLIIRDNGEGIAAGES